MVRMNVSMWLIDTVKRGRPTSVLSYPLKQEENIAYYKCDLHVLPCLGEHGLTLRRRMDPGA